MMQATIAFIEAHGSEQPIYWLYESERDYQAVLAAYVQQACDKNQLAVLIVSAAQKINASSDPRIVRISIDQISHFGDPVQPVLDVDRFRQLLVEQAAAARQAGYSGLRVFADLSPLFPDYTVVETIGRLDSPFHRLTGGLEGVMGLWGFSAHQLNLASVLALIVSQRKMLLGQDVLENHPAYSPEEALEGGNPAVAITRWLQAQGPRRAAERKLQASDQWFRHIFDHIYQFIGAMLPDGTLIEANQAALRFGGLQREDVIGKPFWEAHWWSLSPETQSTLQAAIQRAAQGEFVRYEVDVLGRGPEGGDVVRTIDFSIQPVLDPQGEVALLIPEGRDITDMRTAQKNAQDREALLHAVVSNAPIVLFLVDRAGQIVFSTGKGREGLNQTRPRSVGRSIYELYADQAKVLASYEQALTGVAVHSYLEIDGMYFDTTFIPYTNEQGDTQGVLGVATDVTRSLRAENALYNSQVRFHTIFEKSGVGISLQNLKGHIVECNPAFQAMLGYSAEELINKTYFDVTHPADLMMYIALYNAMVNGHRDSFRVDKRYVRKDGGLVWGQITSSLIRDVQGKPQAIIVMVEDITEKKAMEAELIEVQHRLMHSRENERLHMAQELHDGPLQDMYAISFKIKELERNLSDTDLAQLRDINQDLHHQIRVVRAMCGELRPPALAPFGLEKAIHSHAENFQDAHPGIRVYLELTPDGQNLPENLRLTLFRIYQEFMNNVRRHANATEITIRLELESDQVVLEVQDDGDGFGVPERWIEMARDGHMGLLGVQERVESIGGQLEIFSEEKCGTRARVTVPRMQTTQTDTYNFQNSSKKRVNSSR